jgi:hypothetical protein
VFQDWGRVHFIVVFPIIQVFDAKPPSHGRNPSLEFEVQAMGGFFNLGKDFVVIDATPTPSHGKNLSSDLVFLPMIGGVVFALKYCVR